MRQMKIGKQRALILIFVAQLLCLNAVGQIIENAPSPLSITNAVEIGGSIAGKLLETLDDTSNDLERHLIFDVSSGLFTGVLRDSKDGRVYLFDSKGLLNLITRKSEHDTINVFDTHGKWIYIVKNNKHVFDRFGKRVGSLRVSNGRIIMIEANHKKILPEVIEQETSEEKAVDED